MVGIVSTYACAFLLSITAVVHSVLGEQRLIGPLIAQRGGVLESSLARFLIRFVWHFMSGLFIIIAAALITAGGVASSARTALLAGTAIVIGGAGVVDAIATRGRHVGWPLLVGIGVAAAIALT